MARAVAGYFSLAVLSHARALRPGRRDALRHADGEIPRAFQQPLLRFSSPPEAARPSRRPITSSASPKAAGTMLSNSSACRSSASPSRTSPHHCCRLRETNRKKINHPPASPSSCMSAADFPTKISPACLPRWGHGNTVKTCGWSVSVGEANGARRSGSCCAITISKTGLSAAATCPMPNLCSCIARRFAPSVRRCMRALGCRSWKRWNAAGSSAPVRLRACPKSAVTWRFILIRANPASIAAALSRAVHLSPSQRGELVLRGRQRAGQFSWQAMADQTVAVYRSILAG